jgi:hypothetical protein
MSVETASIMAGDETIKSDISADMSVIPNEVEYEDAEVVEVNEETGELRNA